MQVDKNYYIVDKNVLPEVFLKVVEAKGLLDSGKERTVQAAVNHVGISRSVFYKYRDAIFPLYEHSRGRTITMSANLEDTAGLFINSFKPNCFGRRQYFNHPSNDPHQWRGPFNCYD